VGQLPRRSRQYTTLRARVDVFNPHTLPGARVSVGGSRHYPDLKAVAREIASYAPNTVILTGSTHGVDAAARAAALRHGLELRVYRPRFSQYPTRTDAYFARNRAIVDDATHLVSFWDGTSLGTAQAIAYAHTRGLSVSIRLISLEPTPLPL
jgi:hypothetical protein